MSNLALLAKVADSLISRYGNHEHNEEVTCARDLYCERRGRVFEEDEQWERFSRAFLEWFVVERPWRETGLSPAQIEAKQESDETQARALRAWCGSQRCIAEILSVGTSGVDIVDLVGGAEFHVTEERSLAGMNRGDIVELRVVGLDDSVYLGRTFLYHPTDTRSAIESIVTSMREQGEGRGAIIDHVAGLRSRARSYRHVAPIRIYEDGGLDRI